MKTTINDVIKLIRKSDTPWHIVGGELFSGFLRTVQNCNCPITFAAYKKTGFEYNPNSWRSASKMIGLPMSAAETIVAAADFWPDPNNRVKHVRQRLLKAMKLKEP